MDTEMLNLHQIMVDASLSNEEDKGESERISFRVPRETKRNVEHICATHCTNPSRFFREVSKRLVREYTLGADE